MKQPNEINPHLRPMLGQEPPQLRISVLPDCSPIWIAQIATCFTEMMTRRDGDRFFTYSGGVYTESPKRGKSQQQLLMAIALPMIKDKANIYRETMDFYESAQLFVNNGIGPRHMYDALHRVHSAVRDLGILEHDMDFVYSLTLWHDLVHYNLSKMAYTETFTRAILPWCMNTTNMNRVDECIDAFLKYLDPRASFDIMGV